MHLSVIVALAFSFLAVCMANASGDIKQEMNALKVVEGRQIGGGYGYDSNGGYNSHGHGGNYGHGGHGGHGHHRQQHNHHQPKHVSIKIPYINADGCRFAGDVVCNAAGTEVGFRRCLLVDENQNLWKKPTLTAGPDLTCAVFSGAATMTTTHLCNNNARLLRAAGLLEEKDDHNMKKFHLSGSFSVDLNPCIVNT